MSLLHSGSTAVSGEVLAEGVDFDGTYDYLSRSTDLVGNTDSKTFTFSAWVYLAESTYDNYVFASGETTSSGTKIFFNIHNNGIELRAYDSNSSYIMNVTSTSGIKLHTWCNIVLSFDMSNQSNSKLYINDTAIPLVFNTFINTNIIFTNSKKTINTITYNTSITNRCRLSHIFLDYTYRDLSIEANRRLFITADGKPAPTATLKALNPILYLPMKDAATAHINEGTGGNFVLNGTIATSNRGANQDNCVASYFDGTADYLSATGITGISDSKTITLSFDFLLKDTSQKYFINFGSSNGGDNFTCYAAGGGGFSFFVKNTIGTVIGGFTYTPTGGIIVNKNYRVSISVDLSGTNKRKVILNGTIIPVTWSTYTNDFIMLTGFATPRYRIATDGDATPLMLGNIGELYFDTKHIDLSTNNPFWDSVANKPKPVRQVIRETGVTPLIAMPLDASNAGKNYGTGGDFTANSAPYVGARGASEVWQRTAKFDGSTAYLTSTGLTGITDTKTITLVAYVYKTASINYQLIASTGSNISMYIDTSNQLVISLRNTSGIVILSATVVTAIANTTWTSILLSIDLSNTANRSVYLNGVVASVTWTTYTNDTIDFTNALWVVGAGSAFGNKYNGTLALMLDNTYIDFTSEVNRLKYIDGLSYPLSINEQVAKGIITKPALYLAFEDTANLGLNSGYGGNMTVNGTLVAGADVLG